MKNDVITGIEAGNRVIDPALSIRVCWVSIDSIILGRITTGLARNLKSSKNIRTSSLNSEV